MRLTKLEIKGFKSFANETVIHFNEDVIGVVGPNGSGKSNIVDAIRWVLGEQKSRELRLEKMSNVIFNGTKKRKAGGMAKVSLTFENTKNLLPTDYHTVTITRALFQSGESEYRLNNVPCRLKDITSLFLDTGIGSNSYAIIALGMVDDILADKENARRRMFEQAAGISKYKSRKRETINKLKSTEADLNRIEDLLFEIEGNLKTLEKQAKRTQKYFELKEAYKTLSIQLAILQLAGFKDTYKSLDTQLEKEQEQLREIHNKNRQIEAQIEKVRKANLDKERHLSDRQRDLNQLVGNIRKLENEKNILKEKRLYVLKNQDKLKKQVLTGDERIEQYQAEIDNYSEKLQQEKRLEQELENMLDQAEKQLENVRKNHGNLKSDLDEYLNAQKKLDHQIFELEKQKAVIGNQIESFESERSHLDESVERHKRSTANYEKELAELNSQREKVLNTVSELEKAEIERQNQTEAFEKNLEKIRKQITNVNRKLDARRNEFQLTKSMIDNLEGFPESIKFLNKNQDWGIEPPLLSDLIYTQEEYRIAIENYLEPYLNYYIVNTYEEAKKGIRLLSNAQKGKANFFVLEAFKNYIPPMMLLPNTMQAIDLVETDTPYRNLVSFLLENVLITDKEELPTTGLDQNIVLLSKSGRFIQRRFSLSGGSVGLFEGKKLGRKKNLEVLETQIKRTEREENQLSTEFYNIKTRLEQLKAAVNQPQIDEQRKLLNQLDQQKVSIMTRLESAENFLRDSNQRRLTIIENIERLTVESQRLDKQLEGFMQQVKDSKLKVSDVNESYRKVAEELSEASNAFNKQNITFIKQQNKVNTFQRELNFRQKQLSETQYQLSKDRQALEQSKQESLDIGQRFDEMEKELVEKYALKKEKSAFLSEAEQAYFKARGEINELEDELRKNSRKSNQSQSLINQLKDRFNDIKMQITAIAERVRAEFSISINDLINESVPENIEEASTKQKTERLRARLDNYGEINPMAVEAYNEMNQRYATIKDQRDDILEARKSLNQTIKEIEETATKQFLEAFDQARIHFINVFRSLFTEDDFCDLILTNPEDPLESTIDIIAKPKGKRPQSINQLSGGEKTLTATALLFALYLLKPAPFCIFDEVDAPLDDANIEKFNRIIKKFSKDSQFIIVTHNKQTMSAVDVIYGVYMQEQGVSNVSPVDFRSLENTSILETA